MQCKSRAKGIWIDVMIQFARKIVKGGLTVYLSDGKNDVVSSSMLCHNDVSFAYGGRSELFDNPVSFRWMVFRYE